MEMKRLQYKKNQTLGASKTRNTGKMLELRGLGVVQQKRGRKGLGGAHGV